MLSCYLFYDCRFHSIYVIESCVIDVYYVYENRLLKYIREYISNCNLSTFLFPYAVLFCDNNALGQSQYTILTSLKSWNVNLINNNNYCYLK